MAFDLSTPHGRMMATVLAGIAELERELTQERIRSGIAAAKARGKKLGRQLGQRPKSDRLMPNVLALVAQGRSYRLIGREVGLSKNTVAGAIKRNRTASAAWFRTCPFWVTQACGKRRPVRAGLRPEGCPVREVARLPVVKPAGAEAIPGPAG